MVKVKDVMRKYVVSIDPSLTIGFVAKIMSNNKIGSVVVMDKQKPVGIITSEDVVAVVSKGQHPAKVKVSDFLKREFITCSPEDQLLSVVKIMVKRGIKRIPVVKDGKLEGILTDKEILLTAPEMIDVLSEKLKSRVERVTDPKAEISGMCESCESYSDELQSILGRWMCEECREHEDEEEE